MNAKVKVPVVIALLGLLLLAVVAMPHQPILNRFTAFSLRGESDPKKRIVLINTTLTYTPAFWNREYLQDALRANTQVERRFIADLVRERFKDEGLRQLRGLLRPDLPEVSKSNLLAVISELERAGK